MSWNLHVSKCQAQCRPSVALHSATHVMGHPGLLSGLCSDGRSALQFLWECFHPIQVQPTSSAGLLHVSPAFAVVATIIHAHDWYGKAAVCPDAGCLLTQSSGTGKVCLSSVRFFHNSLQRDGVWVLPQVEQRVFHWLQMPHRALLRHMDVACAKDRMQPSLHLHGRCRLWCPHGTASNLSYTTAISFSFVCPAECWQIGHNTVP